MKSKYFKIEELVQPDTLDLLGESKCWELFDERLIANLDWIKAKFLKVPITINSWLWGGDRKYSGYRAVTCPIGAKKSKHKIGEAVDFIVKGITADEMRLWLKCNQNEMPYPIRLEVGVSWVHLDVANETSEKIIYFNA